MNVAIIGAGNVGSTLGTAWAKKGHRIVYGVRNPAEEKVQAAVKSSGGKASAATIAQAAAQVPIVLFATPWSAAKDAISAAGNLAGKIVVDAMNPLAHSPDWLERGLVVGHETSAGEQVAQWAKGARVVKAFNTIGAPNMANPIFRGQPATMFICGDDSAAKAEVKKLSDDLGFETTDMGPLKIARLLEPLALLWIHSAIALKWGPDFGFKIIRR